MLKSLSLQRFRKQFIYWFDKRIYCVHEKNIQMNENRISDNIRIKNKLTSINYMATKDETNAALCVHVNSNGCST